MYLFELRNLKVLSKGFNLRALRARAVMGSTAPPGSSDVSGKKQPHCTLESVRLMLRVSNSVGAAETKKASEQAGTQADKPASRQTSRQAGDQAGGQTARQAGQQASKQAGRQASRQTGKHAHKQRDGQAGGRQAGKPTTKPEPAQRRRPPRQVWPKNKLKTQSKIQSYKVRLATRESPRISRTDFSAGKAGGFKPSPGSWIGLGSQKSIRECKEGTTRLVERNGSTRTDRTDKKIPAAMPL